MREEKITTPPFLTSGREKEEGWGEGREMECEKWKLKKQEKEGSKAEKL